ncbi:MAG: hypothetical protein DRO18_02585 [Thermoprotei archaeon]|nr:MAG: hypothetical protein DRO18_02585 [Thermoprotei archaeon]
MNSVRIAVWDNPVLRSFFETVIATASRGTVDSIIITRDNPYQLVYEIRYVNWRNFIQNFAGNMLNMIEKAIDVFKAVPLTFGVGSDMQVLQKVSAELGFTYPKKLKMYDRFRNIAKEYFYRISKLSPEEFDRIFYECSKTKLSIGNVLKISIGEKSRYTAPSIVRSVVFFEQGRFFGYRDDRSRKGRPRFARIDVSCNPYYWFLIVATATATLSRVEVIQKDRFFLHLTVNLSEREWKPLELDLLCKSYDKVMDYIRKYGFYLEDYDFMRLLFIFYLYEQFQGDIETFKIPCLLRFLVINAGSRRFNEIAEYEFPLIDVSWLDLSLRRYYESLDDRVNLAKYISRLASTIVSLLKAKGVRETIAREISADRLKVLMHRVMYKLVEPAAAIPLEEVYEMLRTINIEDIQAKLLSELTRTYTQIDDLEKEFASKEAKNTLNTLKSLAKIMS